MAAQLLAGQGFKEVFNLSGGIKAWNGEVATGPVELNLELVRSDETPAGIIKLAYAMEQSLGHFYRSVSAMTNDADLCKLLDLLSSIEDKHKEYLLTLYGAMTASPPSRDAFEGQVSEKIMEGGFEQDVFMRRNNQFLGSVQDIIDLAMMLETQALDLYLRFSQKVEDVKTATTLHRIADEEKAHLQSLGRLREEKTA